MTKRGLSVSEHGDIGDKLQSYRDSLLEIAVFLSKSYSKNSGLYELSKNAANSIDTLRFTLGEKAHSEHHKTEGINGLDLYQRNNLKR